MFSLAIKQMLARKKQTLLILLGIAFGTMVYVVIAGLQLGMREYIAEQLLNNTAHIKISGREEYIEKTNVEDQLYNREHIVQWLIPPNGKRDDSKLENPYGWFTFLENEPHVVAFSPRLSVNAIFTHGKSKWAVSLIGIIPEKQMQVTSIVDYIKEGRIEHLSNAGGRIVVGQGAMKALGVTLGQTIFVSIGQGEPRPFKVVGVVKFGNKDIDERMSFAHLHDVQQLNKTPGRVSEISVSLDDVSKSTELADNWQFLTKDKVESWEQANVNFLQIIKIQDYVRYVITGSILLVASFGIYNVLSIMIGQKQKEIAILRSIGHGPDKILQLFMFQGVLLGFLGSVIGLAMGSTLNFAVEHIDIGFEIGKSNHMLVSYTPSIFIGGFLASLLASILASYLPAKHASELTPLDIIRSNL